MVEEFFEKERCSGSFHLADSSYVNSGKIHGKLNASWKISSLAVNGQSFLVIDGYLLVSCPFGF